MANSSTENPAQQELWAAQTQWFHVFKSMIDQGDIAKIGPHAFAVYAVIKAHTNYASGMAFPGIDLISAKSGVSPAQIKRELKVLEAAGYITKEKHGRSNRYTLREKIQVTDEHGRPQAVATWDYVPSSVQHAVADLKNVLVTGDLAGTKIVHIERLNLQINLGGENTQINLESLLTDLNKLPSSIRDKLRSRLDGRNEVIHSSD
ncbi:helix-turn-helix domain-containing protein [Phytopseudomonas daroniae]|uniref:helix-turn-helix domain-containing protein n=1 Tax=Phytopseudomonas daroniae TaxID=2487519 RepID=UPI001FC9BD96|nr:helix-turn-helix domain-containing protein [Pseudomonas daroniae]